MEFHDDYPQYEFMAHHSEEEGKKKRRTLWNVFWIMLGVTIVELIIGFNASKWGLLNPDRTSSVTLKSIFIGLTLLKAFYIVYKFMHLGDEKKILKYCIIAPYTIFILYLVYICVAEANYAKVHKTVMDPKIVEQKEYLNAHAGEEHHDGGHHEATEEHGEKHSEEEHH